MAEVQLFVLQDEFICTVCSDTMTDPVTIPCGHNFCLNCLLDCWDQNQEFSCPQCRHTFTTRPALRSNTLLSEVVKKLKKTRLSSPSSKNYVGTGDVECDFCTWKKYRAVKSCLTCMASYCQTHLQLHYEGDALKHHKLVDPDRNLKGKLFWKHHKCLEMFCKSDETCICMMCGMTEHNSHEKLELEMETEGKQKQLGATQSEIRRRLEEKEKKLKEMRRTVEEMKLSVERVMEEHEKSFRDLIHCIEETHKNLTEKDSLSFTIMAEFSSEYLLKELSCLKKSLEKISQWDIMTWTPSGHEAPIFTLRPPEPQNREEFLQYFCPLTLDINTAHRDLHLSEENKKVTHEWTVAEYPDHPERFNWWPQVLCREALTGTHCYWEVKCSGDFMEIGVAYKGLGRKGVGMECGLGNNDKSWSLLCSHSQYIVCHNNIETEISAPYSPRIGVYLDWPAGSLSFYSVSHTMTLLHRFNTSFTEPLYPGFYLDLHCSVTISHVITD
ncbi:tripartite motif-containing protein 16-like [Polypterus senegalus]|uniref:tripartite motif-containing protein 16-like n=1 Tax=Polypterus senegalus TaxID=55291 RepID=UPI00196505A7|nr:tripartite motif-containing protein 16-like [Polypterus senegalus]